MAGGSGLVLGALLVMTVLQGGYSLTSEDLFPFGRGLDNELEYGGPGYSSGRIRLSVKFPYFGHSYDDIFVNTGGDLTFGSLFRKRWEFFGPFPLPKNSPPMIAAYFTHFGGPVWYRQTIYETAILSKATQEIQASGIKDFTAAWVFIATWDDVSEDGGDRKKNTFQAVLTTDTSAKSSYVILNYAKLEWYDEIGTTMAGFDAGDGENFYQIPETNSMILKLTNTSNVGVPGKWVFRVSGKTIRADVDSLTTLKTKIYAENHVTCPTDILPTPGHPLVWKMKPFGKEGDDFFPVAQCTGNHKIKRCEVNVLEVNHIYVSGPAYTNRTTSNGPYADMYWTQSLPRNPAKIRCELEGINSKTWTIVTGDCSPGFLPHGFLCYKCDCDRKGTTWVAANTKCKQMGAHLAEPYNTEQYDAMRSILNKVRTRRPYGQVWIGASRTSVSQPFKWTHRDQALMYHPWCNGSWCPDNQLSRLVLEYNCLVYLANFNKDNEDNVEGFLNVPCTRTLEYMCQTEMSWGEPSKSAAQVNVMSDLSTLLVAVMSIYNLYNLCRD